MTRSPFLTALLHPVNLIMLVLTVLSGLCAAWWLAPIGLLFWVVMVTVVARDPGLQLSFTRQSRQPLSQRFQARFDRLDRARITFFNLRQRLSSETRNMLEPVVAAVDDLVEETYQLSLMMSSMDNNFSLQKITGNFDQDIAKIRQTITENNNPAIRQEYESTLQELLNRQEQMKNLGLLLSRFEAQLTGITNAVDTLVTDCVALQGRNKSVVSERVPRLLQSIQKESVELLQFNNAVEKITGLSKY